MTAEEIDQLKEDDIVHHLRSEPPCTDYVVVAKALGHVIIGSATGHHLRLPSPKVAGQIHLPESCPYAD
jgi:hypothetical protein